MALLRMQHLSVLESKRISPIHLNVTRVEPKEMPQGYFEGSPNTRVRFVYELRNDSPWPIEGISAQLFCKCSLSKPIPTFLEPAQTGSVEFFVPIPVVGVREEKLIVHSGKRRSPVVELHARVRSNVIPPLASAMPREVLFSQVIDGDEIPVISRTMTVISIELMGREPIFGHLVTDRPDCFSVQLTKLVEYKDPDPRFVRRVYDFTISSIPSGIREEFVGNVATGNTRSLFVPLRFHGEAGGKLTHSDIVIRMELFEPVSLLPNPVVCRRASISDVAEGKVIFYNRTSKPIMNVRVLTPETNKMHISVTKEGATGEPRGLILQASDLHQLSTSITLLIDGKRYPLQVRVE